MKIELSQDQLPKILYSLFLLYPKLRVIELNETKLQTTCIYLIWSFFKKQKEL